MVAVLATTRDAVEPGEFDDVLSQLGEQLARLVPAPTEGFAPGRRPTTSLSRPCEPPDFVDPLRDHRHRTNWMEEL